MIAQTLSILLPHVWEDGKSAASGPKVHAQETVRDVTHRIRNEMMRIKDELLWPRILVRHAPPPDEIQPIAPDRFL